jgi:hypothetical protein
MRYSNSPDTNLDDNSQHHMQTKQDFDALLNSQFTIDIEGGEIELTLIEVSSVVAEYTEGGQAEPFSAVFRSNTMDMLEQACYQLNHETAGETLIFLVPIGPDEEGMCYEAVYT